MPAKISGMMSNRLASEMCTPRATVFDHAFIRNAAQAHERADFDHIQFGCNSNARTASSSLRTPPNALSAAPSQAGAITSGCSAGCHLLLRLSLALPSARVARPPR